MILIFNTYSAMCWLFCLRGNYWYDGLIIYQTAVHVNQWTQINFSLVSVWFSRKCWSRKFFSNIIFSRKKKPYPPKWAALVIAAEVVVLLHRLNFIATSPAIRWCRKRRSDRREISTTLKIGISSLRRLRYHTHTLSLCESMHAVPFFVCVFVKIFCNFFFWWKIFGWDSLWNFIEWALCCTSCFFFFFFGFIL